MRLQPLPERRVRAGVAGEDPPAGGAAVDAEAAPPARCARPAAPRSSCRRAASSSPTRDRRQRQGRLLGARQAREVGPDHAVEDVGAQRRQRLGQRVDPDRRPALELAHADHAVGEQADRQHVVEVRMADQDVARCWPAPRAAGRRRRCRRRPGRRRPAGTTSSCSRPRWRRSNRAPERSWEDDVRAGRGAAQAANGRNRHAAAWRLRAAGSGREMRHAEWSARTPFAAAKGE